MNQTPAPVIETEVAILARTLGKEGGEIPEDLARYLLNLGISERDKVRMHHLATRNQAGDLTPREHDEMVAFGKAASLLSLLKSKARRTLGISLKSGREV